VCGVITSGVGSRCSKHPRLSGIGANHHVHADPRWARLSKRVIARHVGQYGWICPGDGLEHPAHPARDLTTDHVLALMEGGAPFDPANTRPRAGRLGARRQGRAMSRLEAALAELAEAIRAEVRAEAAPFPSAPDPPLSIADPARLLGIGRSAVYQVIAHGHLQSVKIGRRRLVPARAVTRFIDEALGGPSTAFSAAQSTGRLAP